MSEEQKKTDDDVIDVRKLKNSITGLFKKKEAAPEHATPSPELHHQPDSDDSIPFDFHNIRAGFQKHAKWLIPLLCILVAVSVSVYLRTMPLRLPIGDNWAENNLDNFYRNQLQQQISQQYPTLPQANQAALVEEEWKKFQVQNRDLLQSQREQLAAQFRSQFQDENETPYLLGIDPYYYYRQTYYVLHNGFPGTEIRDGQIWDTYRLAPLGRKGEWNLHNWFGAQWHRFLNLFGNFSLMSTFFFVGTLFAALTVIPGFFIGRIITRSNAGGFFTAFLLATSAFFVARTTGESSDTDVYAVFFPVLIAWLLLQAFEAKNQTRKLLWISAAGFSTGLFAFAWTGWWYIAVLIIPTILVHVLYLLVIQRNTLPELIKSDRFRHPLYLLGTYVITSAIFVTLFTSLGRFNRLIVGPKQFINLKEVAVTSYWPNIRTTVAELNVPSLSNVIETLGGKFLLILAILGILLLLLKKEERQQRTVMLPFFLTAWLIASLWATTKGVRFILQVTPVFAIALGVFMGLAWHYASSWSTRELKLPRRISQVVIFLLLCLLLIQPAKTGYSQAFNSAPSMNDGWYNALMKIKNEAPQDSIITSWWDFGHWFKAIAERPVTFDGGTQVGWGAYWVGKSLLTSDEKETTGIVRMLNCGQNTAFNELDKIISDTPASIEILHRIIVQKKTAAATILQEEGVSKSQTETILQYTHCDPPADYYITSEDMVGKSGVWGHFGSWDFTKAVVYQKVSKLNDPEALSYLTSTLNYSDTEATKIVEEARSTSADQWIAPWPSYLSSFQPCDKTSPQELRCRASLNDQQALFIINLDTHNVMVENNPAVVPNSLVYATKQGIEEKEFDDRQKIGISLILIPRGDEYRILLAHPLQASSMFTKLFFLEGHGLQCFSRFDDTDAGGFKIITWSVDYECGQENKVYFLPQEEVHAAHILISTQDRSEAEALAFAESIKQNVTISNFAEYAQHYSEDPGSKERGGDVGWFGKGQMVAEFEQAAFSLQPGQISQPVKTQFGYHLILLLETREQ